MFIAKICTLQDQRLAQRRIIRATKKVSSRIRRAGIKAIHAKRALARSTLAASVYQPIMERAQAKQNRILHAVRRATV